MGSKFNTDPVVLTRESLGFNRRSAIATLLSMGLPSSVWLSGCGGGGGDGAGGSGSSPASSLLVTTKNLNSPANSTPSCGGPSLPSCDGTYHLSIHSSGGVNLGLVLDWAETRLPGDNIGITGGAQVRPGAAYAIKAVPDNAKLWLQLNGKAIPDSGNWDLNLTPGFDNTLFAYVAIMPGDPAPNFKGLDASGQLHTLSALRGKWALVTFGAWFCAGARNFAPVLSSIYSQYHPAGLEVLSVLVAPNSELRIAGPADLNAWSQTYGVNYPLVADTDDACQYYNREYLSCTYYSCSDTPSIFLIDPQGTIAYRYRGWDPQAGLAGVLAKLYA